MRGKDTKQLRLKSETVLKYMESLNENLLQIYD